MGKLQIGTVIVVLLIIFFSNVLPIISIEKEERGILGYGFFNSHQEDYLQYVAMIRQGKEDRSLAFINQYDVFNDRKYIIQPLYNIVGLFTSYLPVDQFQTYFVLRIFSLLLFLFVLFLFLYLSSTSVRQRFFSVIFFGITTAIYSISSCNNMPCIRDPETYASAYTNAWLRLLVLPPHHYLALAMFILMLLTLPFVKLNILSLLKTGFIFLTLALLHPFIAMQGALIAGLFAVVNIIKKRSIVLPIVIHALLSTLIVVASALYTSKVTQALVHTTFSFPSIYYIGEYLKSLSLGIIYFVMFLPFAFKFLRSRYGVIIFLWAVVPFLAQLLPLVREYMGVYRLMQSVQHFPLVLLGAYALDTCIFRYKRMGLVAFFIVLGINLYAYIPMYVIQFRYKTNPQHPEFILARTIQQSRSLVKYIPENKSYPVVLAGDTLSSIIPATGKYKTPNAIIGNNPREKESPEESRRFFYGLTPVEAKEFLKKYKIDYIIFGIDTQIFAHSQYVSSDFLKEIYTKDGYSIIQVVNL